MSQPDRHPQTVVLTLLAAALALTTPVVRGQSPGGGLETFSDTTQVTAVELVVNVEDIYGEMPDDLRPEDFEVIEDGEPKPVIGVEIWRRGTVIRQTAAGPELRVEESPLWTWRSVIYFDQVLSSSRSIRRAAEAMAEHVTMLTRLGTVEIVTANPTLEVVLAPTRSSPLIERTLRDIARSAVGRDELRRIRKQLVRQAQVNEGTKNLRDSKIAAATAEEAILLGRQHDELMGWISRYDADGPRALFLVNDGYDLQPQEFYFSLINNGEVSQRFNAKIYERQAAPDVRELSQTLAASGWVTVNMALGALDAATTIGAEESAQGRLGHFARRDGIDYIAPGAAAIVVRPLDPLRQMSIATGGETLTGTDGLPLAIGKLRDKVRLTYQVARLPDGKLRQVEVRALRDGLRVEAAPRWTGSAALEEVAAARARRLLAGGGEHGDVPVVAAVALEPPAAAAAEPAAETEAAASRRGKLQARVDLQPLKAGLARSAPTAVRVTLAASFPDGPPFVRHDLVEAQELADLDAWTYATGLSMPAAVERVAVVFQELTSGAWGGAVASLVEGELPAAVRAEGASDHDLAAATEGYVPQDLLPERKSILLLPPDGGGVVRGRVRLEPLVANPSIARVEYRLDGEVVATSDDPPFAAKVDFGDLPEARAVEAIALDAGGRELGRDSLLVNEGVGAFRVRIIEPRSGDRIGAVDVEAEVRLPGGDEALEQVEMFWNGRRVATLFEPPFRQRVMVPPQAPVGYISVVATRRDGSTAEDVVFMNGTGNADRVDVKLVELFTVVNDPQSRPVRGLDRGDFRVFEDGTVQRIAGFRPGTEMPLAIGLLMDTSASMTPALRQAQTAAIDFLMLTLDDQDRASVIGFNDRPRLVQGLTGDHRELVDAIASLRPGGTSALCDALVFSLVEMQRVPGRRALVVLTDGVGREERVDFSTCLRFVQRSAIPIYAILLAGDDPTATEHGGVDSEKLGRLVGAVGGKFYVARAAEQLGHVYREVIDELESQYLLTYYPPERPDEGWRTVDVVVDQAGLVARTVNGYYP